MARFDIQMDADIKEKLKELSKQEGRSMTKEVEKLIIQEYNKLVKTE